MQANDLVKLIPMVSGMDTSEILVKGIATAVPFLLFALFWKGIPVVGDLVKKRMDMRRNKDS